MNRLLLGFILLLSAYGYTQIGMQQWRIHFSVYNNVGIAQTDEGIFMAAANGVVEYNKEDNSLSTMTVINGLSDLGISTINGEGSVLAVGYENGNLDIFEGNSVTNLPFIKTAEVSGSKRINNLSFSGNLIYVCTEIGLVVVDVDRKEIKDTYYPYNNPVIYDASVINDTLYVATANGLYFAPENKPFLNDLTNWSKFTNFPLASVNGPFTELETYNGSLALAYKHDNFDEDTLYFITNGAVTTYDYFPYTIKDLNSEDDKLIMSLFASVEIIGADLDRSALIFGYPLGVPSPRGAVFYDEHYWISDENFGLVKALNSFSAESIYNNSPFADGSYRLDIQYGKVLVAGGGLTHNLVNNFNRNGVYVFEDEEWISMNYLNQDSIYEIGDFDYISAAINPNNTDEYAFSSFSKGGLKWVKGDNTISEVYNPSNSVIEFSAGTNMIISDMKFDNDGNLWVINQGVEPLKVFMADGTQHSFSMGSAAKGKYPFRLMIDSDGRKWVAFNTVGIVVFDDGGTIDDPSDDQIQSITNSEGYGNLPSNFIKTMVEDIDGEVWIGTEEGLVVMYNTSNIFDGGFGDYDANSILLEVDGEVEELFGKTNITSNCG